MEKEITLNIKKEGSRKGTKYQAKDYDFSNDNWHTCVNHPKVEFNDNLEFRFKRENGWKLHKNKDGKYRYFNGKVTTFITPAPEVLETIYGIKMRKVGIDMKSINNINIEAILMYKKVENNKFAIYDVYLTVEDIIKDYPELNRNTIVKSFYRESIVAKEYTFKKQWIPVEEYKNLKSVINSIGGNE